jgi:flagellar hook-associated protein 2
MPLTSSLDSIEKYLTGAPNFDAAANVQFTINGTLIDLKKTYANATINDIMTAVNTSAAGVQMKYDALKDTFTLTSKTTGVTSGINLTDTDPTNGLFKNLGILQSNVQAGKDAIFSLTKLMICKEARMILP